jgi:hypothetical protein
MNKNKEILIYIFKKKKQKKCKINLYGYKTRKNKTERKKKKKKKKRKKAHFLNSYLLLLVSILQTPFRISAPINSSSKTLIITVEGLKATTANFVLSGINEDINKISGHKSQLIFEYFGTIYSYR